MHACTHTNVLFNSCVWPGSTDPKKKDSSTLHNNISETKCIVLNLHGKRTSENTSACLCALALFKSCKFEESMFSPGAIFMPPREIEIVWNKWPNWKQVRIVLGFMSSTLQATYQDKWLTKSHCGEKCSANTHNKCRSNTWNKKKIPNSTFSRDVRLQEKVCTPFGMTYFCIYYS